MSRSLKEIQEDIRTLTRVCSWAIDDYLKELADEVGELCKQVRYDALDSKCVTPNEDVFDMCDEHRKQGWNECINKCINIVSSYDDENIDLYTVTKITNGIVKALECNRLI